MAVCDNARFLSQPVTGVQRYAENITRELFAIRDGIRLLAPPGPLRALDGIDIQQIGTSRGHAWEQVDLPIYVGRHGGLLIKLVQHRSRWPAPSSWRTP